MNNDSVKKNLERIRTEKKLSQEDMAGVLGVARNTYRNIEKGDTKLISDTVMKVAEWAGLTPEEVVLGYLPVEDRDGALRDARERMDERITMLTNEYEEKLARSREEITLLRDLIREKDDNIRNLKSWIAMLEKRSGE